MNWPLYQLGGLCYKIHGKLPSFINWWLLMQGIHHVTRIEPLQHSMLIFGTRLTCFDEVTD